MALRLQKVVSDKIDEKIVIMKNNESFKKLSTDLSDIIFAQKHLIEKIKYYIEEIPFVEVITPFENNDLYAKSKVSIY